MKKNIYVLMVMTVLLTLTSCVKIVRHTNRSVEQTKSINVRQFERIQVKAFCDVHYTQADSVSVKFVGSQRALDHLRTISDGTTLTIEQSKRFKWLNLGQDDDVEIYITSPDLTGVAMAGAGDFVVNGKLDTDTMTVKMEGTGDIQMNDLICDKVILNLKGVGDIDLKNVTASQTQITLKGVGDVKVHFNQCDLVDCSLEGVGDVKLSGKVKNMKRSIRGTGSIDLAGLKVDNDISE